MRPLWNNSGEHIIDFEYTYSNEEGLKYLNLTPEQFTRLTITNSPTLTDKLRVSVMEEMLHVYTRGEKSATFVFNPVLNKYARSLRTKLRKGVLTVIQDVTNEHRTIIRQLEEQSRKLEAQALELQEQRTLVDNILKHSSNGISVTEAIRNDQGVVIDARTVLANDAAVRFTGLPLDIYLSKTAIEVDPNILESPYYHAYVKTLETGEPAILQHFPAPHPPAAGTEHFKNGPGSCDPHLYGCNAYQRSTAATGKECKGVETLQQVPERFCSRRLARPERAPAKDPHIYRPLKKQPEYAFNPYGDAYNGTH